MSTDEIREESFPRHLNSTRSSARVVARRLWPNPDPVSYAKRQAVSNVAAGDAALRTAIDLRARANGILFEDLTRLHICPAPVEALLVLVVANLNLASRQFGDALAFLETARIENTVRTYDARLLERCQRG
jgi:hypothetical protein